LRPVTVFRLLISFYSLAYELQEELEALEVEDNDWLEELSLEVLLEKLDWLRELELEAD
jgi:hypothetical protein